MTNTEEFRPIADYPDYLVSSKGRVLSFRNGQGNVRATPLELKHGTSQYGYHFVDLYVSGRSRRFFVHVLVAEAFLYKYADNLEVNHIDEDKTNNCVDNLEWVTHKENINYGSCRDNISNTLSKHHLDVRSSDRNEYTRALGRLLMKNKYTGEIAKHTTVQGRVYVLKTTTWDQWDYI